MIPNRMSQIAVTTAIATTLLLFAYSTGNRSRCAVPPAPPVVTPMITAPADAETVADADAPIATDVENKVRQAARDFIKEQYPRSRAEGVFLLAFRAGNLYLAGVDMTSPSDSGRSLRATQDLLVRLYVRKNGGTYWRAEQIGSAEAARLRAQAL
ncbi:MAG: hypothetical protein SFU56_19750 [Capsulimonadales bacterium]|nr:hypothetical protein [Capsulimonadales bacterium]